MPAQGQGWHNVPGFTQTGGRPAKPALTPSLYIKLSDLPGKESDEVAPDIVLDLDDKGRLVGIDVDHASEHMDLSSLEAMGLPLKGVAVR